MEEFASLALSLLLKTGLCAGAEVLADGHSLWCQKVENALYVYTADNKAKIETIPNKIRPYILDWNFLLFKTANHKHLEQIVYLIKSGDNPAGVMTVDVFAHATSQTPFKIEALYNQRGQLVFVEIR
jgi:hypothetical protein